MSRKDYIRQYLFQLVLRYETLEKERQQLLDTAARIAEIQAEKTDLIADAQDALNKYNAVYGTTYTLPQVRAWYNAEMSVISQPPESPP